MMFAEGSVFAIPAGDRWILSGPLQGIHALVNRQAIAALAANDENPLPSALDELRRELRAPAPQPEIREGPPVPQFLGIIPTRACNMDCRYCGFGAADAPEELLDAHAAVATVDWYADACRDAGRATMDVRLFGGEPFLARDLVEVVAHRTRIAARERGLAVQLEAATNGAYPESTARFAADYFTTLVLSLDGPEALHNRHRPLRGGHGSFDQVMRTAAIFRDSQAAFCVRVCVTNGNVADLASIADWICGELRPDMIDFETLHPTAESHLAGLRTPDPFAFARSYRAAREAASRWGVKANYAAAPNEEPRVSFCPVGQDALILTPDRCLHACYLLERDWRAVGLDLRLGTVDRAGEVRLDFAAIRRVRQLVGEKDGCRACFCRYWCAGGCHVNRHAAGPDFADFCVQTRLISAAVILEDLGEVGRARRLLDGAEAAGFACSASHDIANWEAAHA
jgi:uncharacterized protein